MLTMVKMVAISHPSRLVPLMLRLLLVLVGITFSESLIQPTEINLKCPDGITIAGQRWQATSSSSTGLSHESSAQQVLCLHGWMDNCRSFYYLAPRLVHHMSDLDVVAIDLPGHGLSSHKSSNGPPMVQAEAVYYIKEAIELLEWNDDNSLSKVTIIGHSLGAAFATLFAASFPELVERLVLLDGAGFVARNVEDVAAHVRGHVKRRQLQTIPKAPRHYESIEKAVKTRLQSARLLPGKVLSLEAATKLVARAVVTTNDDKVWFRHDSRYSWPSLMYYTWEQNEAIFSAVKCPTCILLAKNGWQCPDDVLERIDHLLQPVTMKILPGSHYLHADPESAAAVVTETIAFLSKKDFSPKKDFVDSIDST